MTPCCVSVPRRQTASLCGALSGGRSLSISVTSAGSTERDHAYTSEVSGGQLRGRNDGRRLQRRASRWPGSAAEIPLQQTGVSGTLPGRGGMLGGSHCKADPDTEGDQATALVHGLRRVSNLLAFIFSPTTAAFESASLDRHALRDH